MKKLPLFFLLTLSITAKSQKESFYVFDANWKPTKIQTAHFALHIRQVNDSCWQWDYYNFIGPLIKTEQYRDQDGKELDGVSRYYNKKGLLDSAGTYRLGKKNGDFWKWSDGTSKNAFKYVYREDSLIETIDLQNQKKDSSVRYSDEKESDYPGGAAGWRRYLVKNLNYPERAVGANIQGQVLIRFVVDKAGNVMDTYISGSIEYSLDEEALRIIKDSGKWEPSFQNGHTVKSYKMQPINFRMN
jgi:protein TonB